MNKTLIGLAAWAAFGVAQAGEVYTGVGTHGLMLGYAQALSPWFTVRGDYASAGSRTKQETDNGIDYNGKLTYNRAGLFGDLYPFRGGFRLTAGVTFNNMKLDLEGLPQGNQITIGSTTYTTQAGDRFDATVKFPSTTPYLGLGWGHQLSEGWGFVFDLGASIGRATVTAAASGPTFDSLSGAQKQQLDADVNAQTQKLRDGVGKIRAIPLIAIGLNYRF